MAWAGGSQRHVAAGQLAPLLLDGKRVTVLCEELCLLQLLWPGFSASCLRKTRLHRAARLAPARTPAAVIADLHCQEKDAFLGKLA